jgi:hypothetical protein
MLSKSYILIFLFWSTQKIRNFTGRQLTPTKYLIDEEENQTPGKTCTTVRSPYNRDKLSYKTLFKDGSVSFHMFFLITIGITYISPLDFRYFFYFVSWYHYLSFILQLLKSRWHNSSHIFFFLLAFCMLFFPVVVWVLVVFHQGLFQLYNQGSDLLTLGRPGRMTNASKGAIDPENT